MKTEADIQSEIMIELSKRGHKIFRANAGKIQDARTGMWIKLFPKGFSDLCGWRAGDGKFIAIEVKNEKGKLRAEQVKFAEFAKSQPILYGVARSAEEAIVIVEGESDESKTKKKLLANKYPETYGAKQRYTRDQVEAVTVMEVNRVMGNLLASVLLTLRDEHGFGNQRLAKFMDDTFNQMDAISNEYVTAQDILETIEGETGLNYYDYANEIAKKVKV